VTLVAESIHADDQLPVHTGSESGKMMRVETPLTTRQARLLLPEPLAANRGELVVGSLHFKVCLV
jgi:hypothetical protein